MLSRSGLNEKQKHNPENHCLCGPHCVDLRLYITDLRNDHKLPEDAARGPTANLSGTAHRAAIQELHDRIIWQPGILDPDAAPCD
jgi:hypothetical protein